MLEIKITYEGTIPVLNLKGRFDGYGASLFDEESGKISSDMKYWIIDFSGVEYLSSAGIRSLIKVEKALHKKTGWSILVGLYPDLKRVLELTGLLGQFHISDSLSEALKQVKETQTADKSATKHLFDDREYQLRWASKKASILDLWGSLKNIEDGELSSKSLIRTNLKELGYAFGIGGFGNTKGQAFEALGEFISTPTFAGIIPADEYCLSDFLITDKPSESDMYLLSAYGFSGKPAGVFDVKSRLLFTLKELIEDTFYLTTKNKEEVPPLIGLIILAEPGELICAHFETKNDISIEEYCKERFSNERGTLIIGIAADETALKSSKDKSVSQFMENIIKYPITETRFFHGHGVLLAELPTLSINMELGNSIQKISNLENLKTVAHIQVDSEIKNARVWFYLPKAVRTADEKRLKIDVEKGTELLDEWDVIIRRIYSNAGRVVIRELHGGFTSKTFYVTSYDKEGRRLLPTVLKIGSIKDTQNEVNAYHDYVKKFILNNSVTIMGTTTYGNWGGLRYNFVGINGPDSKLTWLTDYYRRLPADELIPLFDRVFTDILKPWYGQPKWEPIYPYAEHNPLEMFPGIFDSLEKEVGISPDEKIVYCKELGMELPNPFYFLKYEYPKRKGYSQLWYKSITHGDLNMQNILLDEVENIYIIDFSETKPRNIVSDFARLEPIFTIEMTNLKNNQDLKELIEFLAGLAEVNSIKEKPPFQYKGSDPMVEKAYKMICCVRKYADIVTLFDDDIIPYLLAILEWTHPIVTYRSVGPLEKRLALYYAAFICKKIMEFD